MSCKIGVDGGGTKTEFILVDSAGRVLARRTAPGCSPSLLEPAAIRQLIDENLAALVAAAHCVAISHLVLCMAGSRIFWREFAAGLTGCGRVQACDDSFPVLELAAGGAPGLVLHAGTGSFVAARGPDGAAHYAGGLGWRLGDPASAHDLGRRALVRTMLELQGWEPASALGAAVCEQTGAAERNQLLRHIYAPGADGAAIASVAPLVTQLADDDPVARAILADSVTELARLAERVRRQLFATLSGGEQLPVGLSGAILLTPAARAAVAAVLGDRHQWRDITDPPIEGVRRLLARL